MNINEALSKEGINALIKASEFGKDTYKENFESASVTKLTKNGFWADIKDKQGKVHKIRCKIEGKLTTFYER